MAWLQEGKVETKPIIPAGIGGLGGLPNVCVCVPHHGFVSLEWVNTTYGPLRFVPRTDFVKTHRIARGILNLDTMRNELVKMALEDKTVSHILFLDTDVIMESPSDVNEAVSILLQCNVPVVSGLYRAKKSKGDYPYAMWIKNPDVTYGYAGFQSWTGNWLSVDTVGFGFVLLRREVFEKIPFPWFTWDKPTPSEDFVLCEKIKQYGYEIKVMTDVKFSHAGNFKVKIDGSVQTLDV